MATPVYASILTPRRLIRSNNRTSVMSASKVAGTCVIAWREMPPRFGFWSRSRKITPNATAHTAYEEACQQLTRLRERDDRLRRDQTARSEPQIDGDLLDRYRYAALVGIAQDEPEHRATERGNRRHRSLAACAKAHEQDEGMNDHACQRGGAADLTGNNKRNRPRGIEHELPRRAIALPQIPDARARGTPAESARARRHRSGLAGGFPASACGPYVFSPDAFEIVADAFGGDAGVPQRALAG